MTGEKINVDNWKISDKNWGTFHMLNRYVNVM